VSLFDSAKDEMTVGYTQTAKKKKNSPMYGVEMHKRDSGSDSGGHGGAASGGVDPVSGLYIVSYTNMRVNINQVL
jgi:hypothetical protein